MEGAAVNWRYVKHITANLVFFLVLPVAAAHLAWSHWDDLVSLKLQVEAAAGLNASWLPAAALGLVVAFLARRSRRTKVYIVDFACYKPADSRKCPAELMEYFARRLGVYTEQTMDFFKKVFLKAGIGEETYAPPAMFQHPKADFSLEQARAESEEVMFGAVDEVLAKTGVKAKDIGILVVNSSCFTPTPSLSSMLVNHYKMGSDVRSFNLDGMGCSASIIAIDLAKDLLGMHPNTYALVVSTENITHNLYKGNYRPMLVTNCLFKVGGAAILLTNIPSERRRCKYELLHTVRIHNGADDKAYNCIMQETDSEGIVGINLTKHIMVAAADALKKNLAKLGPLVLPLSEQLLFAANVIGRSVFKIKGLKPYIPDFKLAFDHFLLHAGGRAVIDELEKSLRLGPHNVEASRMTLHRFGNTSSSCVWYELAYVEAKGRVKWGDRLWQLGVGSGFKCNSAVWKALRDIHVTSCNPWLDCINNYPVDIPTDMEDVPRLGDALYFQTVDGAIVHCKTGQVVHQQPAADGNTMANGNNNGFHHDAANGHDAVDGSAA